MRENVCVKESVCERKLCERESVRGKVYEEECM